MTPVAGVYLEKQKYYYKDQRRNSEEAEYYLTTVAVGQRFCDNEHSQIYLVCSPVGFQDRHFLQLPRIGLPIGWGALCVGGAGAYIFAKRAVNSERAARHEERMKRKEATLRQEKQSMPAPVKPPIPVAPTPSAASANETRTPSSEYGGGIAEPSPHPYNPPPHSTNQQHGGHMSDDVGNPSQEGARDPAPTRHEPDTEAQRVAEKGKYEAAETFRSRKGNRLS